MVGISVCLLYLRTYVGTDFTLQITRHRKKFKGVKSYDLGGQTSSPQSDVMRSSNVTRNKFNYSWVVYSQQTWCSNALHSLKLSLKAHL